MTAADHPDVVVDLVPSRLCPAEARQVVRSALELPDGLSLWHDVADLAVLLTSELVTHAVESGSASLQLCVARGGDGSVRVAVRDDDPTLPVLADDWADHPEGPGLALVALLSDRWSADPAPGGAGKVVSFEVGGRGGLRGC